MVNIKTPSPTVVSFSYAHSLPFIQVIYLSPTAGRVRVRCSAIAGGDNVYSFDLQIASKLSGKSGKFYSPLFQLPMAPQVHRATGVGAAFKVVIFLSDPPKRKRMNWCDCPLSKNKLEGLEKLAPLLVKVPTA